MTASTTNAADTTLPRVTGPVLPMRQMVLFPKVAIGLRINRHESIKAIEAALGNEFHLIAVAQRDTSGSVGGADDLYEIATLAEVIGVQPLPNGDIQVVLQGISRARITHLEPHPACLGGEVELLEETPASGPDADALIAHVQTLIARRHRECRSFDPEALELMRDASDAGVLADLLATQIVEPVEERQRLLEELDALTRLEEMASQLTAEIDRVETEQRVKSRVRERMEKNQREYYLREQLRAIHDELSGGEGSEYDALRDRIQQRGLPEAVETKLLKEVTRLERMTGTSPEANIARTYIETVLSLPWTERTADNLDLAHAARVLDDDHFGLDQVKERILEFLAVRKLTQRRGGTTASILCLAGPPGVGKTTLVQSIATAMGRKFVRVSLGGVRDEAEIRGHRRTYIGALPGRIVAAMKTAGTTNPVILLDEIDKMTSDQRGDPAAAMLEVLDPGQNHTFTDHYLEIPYDLSQVLFVATANYLGQVPRPLRDRMEIIEISGYSEQEKVEIGRRYLLPKQLDAHGLESDQIGVPEHVWLALVRGYTREAGVRGLDRHVAAICRKVASEVATDRRRGRLRLTELRLEAYLGPARYGYDERESESQIGVVMGLGTTEIGGELIPVEAIAMPGAGSLTITGQAGDVMRESARAGMTFLRAHAEVLGISTEFPNAYDVHIHLPDAAVPKDGPSAGITIATALVSALTGRPVRADVAMTGEITLRGRVLPIGGLRDKTLAAHRAGIRRVIAPFANQRDYASIPTRVAAEMEFVWVEHLDEVLAAALDMGNAVEELRPAADWLPGISVWQQPRAARRAKKK